jgi:hypothetical protein
MSDFDVNNKFVNKKEKMFERSSVVQKEKDRKEMRALLGLI